MGPVLLVSVYMPTDYGDSECLESYVATCACITALFQDSDAVNLVVAGDFNSQTVSRLYNCFLKFVKENKLQLTDLNQLKDVFTFCNDSATTYSWIDHVVCSQGVDSLVSSCHVQYQYVSSDHKPLSVTFDQFLPNTTSSSVNTNNSAPVNNFQPDWS